MASYNIQSSLRPKARPTKEQDDKPAVGIGSRDKPEEKEEKSFFDTVSDWFTGAGANLTPEEQARENGATLYTLPEFDEATRRSAEESALYRMDMGITSSLVEGGDEAFREKLPDGTTYSPPKRPGLTFEEAEDALVTVPEPEPVTVQELDGGDGLMSRRADTKGSKVTKYDSMLFEEGSEQVKGVQGVLTQLGYVPRGVDGLMGDGTRAALRKYQNANNLPVTGAIDDITLESLQGADKNRFTFSEATNGLFTNYVDDGIEGAGHHLGGADYQDVGITLEAGIVPDSGLKYKHDGNIITLPRALDKRWGVLSRAGVTRSNFNEDNVIMDDVVKSGVKRSDYRSDEEFTKAVLTAFQDKAEDKVIDLGYAATDFEDDAMKTLGDLAWNAGTDSFGWTSMEPVLEELAKPLAERNVTRIQGLLDTAPTQGGRILGGVMKRRAIQYNWSVPSDKRVTRVVSDATTGTGTYHFADGTTKEISRTRGADTQDVDVPEL